MVDVDVFSANCSNSNKKKQKMPKIDFTKNLPDKNGVDKATEYGENFIKRERC